MQNLSVINLPNFIPYYFKNTEILIDLVNFTGMFCHTYFYQTWHKQIEITNSNYSNTILKIILIIFINDFVNVITKFNSIKPISDRTKTNQILFLFILPILILIFSMIILISINIEGYNKTFLFAFSIWSIINLLKTILIYNRIKYLADILRIIDVIVLINTILIILTDPIINSEDCQNCVIFYEIYFRFMEFHLLMFAFILIYNDQNIDADVMNKLFTTSALIGKYDSFRFSVVLILAHYLFIFINGLAFGIRYWMSFITIIIAFLTISNYKQRKMSYVYFYFSILMIFNVLFYIKALYEISIMK